MILEEFDFSVLDSRGFLEDSVREEIITPILHELGYSVTGPNRIERSKPLIHPFVYIGTIQRQVNIIPDYLLYINDVLSIVIDAKAPNENIVSGANVEQAFSYAIHKDVRVWLYGLCNGRKLTIFNISEYTPIVEIELTRINENWKLIESFLKPEYFENPHLADFHPDLGMYFYKLNVSKKTDFIFLNVFVSTIIKMSDYEYTISSGLKYGDSNFMASFDFNRKQYEEFLKLLSTEYRDDIEVELSRQPYLIDFPQECQLEIGVVANLTDEVIKSGLSGESFVPFKVKEFLK